MKSEFELVHVVLKPLHATKRCWTRWQCAKLGVSHFVTQGSIHQFSHPTIGLETNAHAHGVTLGMYVTGTHLSCLWMYSRRNTGGKIEGNYLPDFHAWWCKESNFKEDVAGHFWALKTRLSDVVQSGQAHEESLQDGQICPHLRFTSLCQRNEHEVFSIEGIV